MPSRGLLLAASLVSAALFVCAPSAGAAPELIGHGSQYVAYVAIDGNLVYWDEGSTLERLDLASGVKTELYDSGGDAYVDDLAAGGGRIAIRAVDTSGHYLRQKILVGEAGAESLHTVESALDAPVPGRSCGTELSLGNVTPTGGVVYNVNTLTRAKRGCARSRHWRMSVFENDPSADPRFPAPPRLLAKSKLGAGVHPQLVGNKLLLQTGTAQTILDLGGGPKVSKHQKRDLLTLGELDGSANLLMNQFVPGSTKGSAWIYWAANAYASKRTIAKGHSIPYFTVCGPGVLSSRFGRKSSLTLLLLPAVSPPVQLKQILPPTTREIGVSACTSDRIVFAAPSQSSTDIYTDTLTP